MAPTRVVAVGVVAVLAFDLLVSLASRRFGFPYERASLGSYVLYFGIGYLAARGSVSDPVPTAATVAGVVGLADASLGWAISLRLGASKLPDGVTLTPGLWVSTALIVVALAAAFGAIGGLAGR